MSLVVVALLGTPHAQADNSDWKGPDYNWLKRFSGENRTVLQYRSLGGDDDLDFYNYLTLRGRGLFDDWFDVYMSGRVHRDFSGRSNSLSDDVFTSIEDVDTNRWEEQIYQLYGDVHDPDRIFGLRFGRQYIDNADSLHLDGVLLRLLEKEKVSLELFAGQPVSYYSNTSDSIAGGGTIQVKPWEGGRARFTYTRYEDDRADRDDDRFVLDLWQRFGYSLFTHARAAVLNDDFQMGGADVTWIALDGDFDVNASVRRWEGLGRESLEYSPLYSVLGDLEPYTFVTARMNKRVLPWLIVSPGVAFRIMDGDDRGVRNRQYGNYDLTLLFEPNQVWNFSVSGQYWDVSGGDRFWGVTGEVEYRPTKWFEGALGTSYLDYRYDVISDYGYATIDTGDIIGHTDGGDTRYVTQISPDVYSVYTRLNFRFTRNVSLRVHGEIEDDSTEDDLGVALRTSLNLRF